MTDATTVPCTECHGRGYHKEPKSSIGGFYHRKCLFCLGRGQLPTKPDVRIESCRRCEGTGEDPNPIARRGTFPECWDCGGHGEVVVHDDVETPKENQ